MELTTALNSLKNEKKDLNFLKFDQIVNLSLLAMSVYHFEIGNYDDDFPYIM